MSSTSAMTIMNSVGVPGRTTRKRHSQAEHDRMVVSLAYAIGELLPVPVRADGGGFKKPYPIVGTKRGRIATPDIITVGQGPIIVEVETSDSIEHIHTALEWEIFGHYAREHGGIFVLAVPPDDAARAERRLWQLSIEAVVWGWK